MQRIEARAISKKYRLGGHVTAYNVLRERVVAAIRSGFRRERDERQDFWALRDVSFSIGDAEVVGLIGKNGAGKSTLLKIISHITEPTDGEVHLWGRVASLLEIGVGFHPELSGRENIFLNGAILGMSRAEIRRKFDEIVQFAEVERFLETPVKRYSSGMFVRLAFAVAAHLEPDILIVDEVLSVGDSAFQQKCMGKIQSIRAQGRSIVVVSHNMPTVANLCQKVIWLRDGRVHMEGKANEVIRRYLSEGLQNDLVWTPRHPRVSAFEFHSISVVRSGSEHSEESFSADSPIDIVFDFEIHEAFPPAHIELRLVNDAGHLLLTSSSADAHNDINHPWGIGRQEFRCHIPGRLLAPGRYFLTVMEPYGGHEILRDNVIAFSISEENALPGERGGMVAPKFEWSLRSHNAG